jgi:hypothetical protein
MVLKPSDEDTELDDVFNSRSENTLALDTCYATAWVISINSMPAFALGA